MKMCSNMSFLLKTFILVIFTFFSVQSPATEKPKQSSRFEGVHIGTIT